MKKNKKYIETALSTASETKIGSAETKSSKLPYKAMEETSEKKIGSAIERPIGTTEYNAEKGVSMEDVVDMQLKLKKMKKRMQEDG